MSTILECAQLKLMDAIELHRSAEHNLGREAAF